MLLWIKNRTSNEYKLLKKDPMLISETYTFLELLDLKTETIQSWKDKDLEITQKDNQVISGKLLRLEYAANNDQLPVCFILYGDVSVLFQSITKITVNFED